MEEIFQKDRIEKQFEEEEYSYVQSLKFSNF